MYKKTTLLAALLLWNVMAFSQYLNVKYTCDNQNPGGLNQGIDDLGLVARGWTPIMGGSASPVWSAAQTIPFAFNLNGTNFTSYKVSTTGVVTFDLTAVSVPGENNVALPSNLIPDNSVCVWGLTMVAGSNDSIGKRTFGTAPNRQHWVWFSSMSPPGGSGFSYWGIVFEETTNNIFIVDARTQPAGVYTLTLGIQIDATTAYQIAGSPNVASSVITTNTGVTDASDQVYYKFNTSLLSYDIRPKTFSLKNEFPYRDYNVGPYPITGSVINLGSQNITSMVLNYSVDGGAPVSSAGLLVNVVAGSCYNFSHPTPWNPASPGWHIIKFWVSDLNGNADQDNSNDTITAKVFTYPDKPDVHKVIIEEATGTWCGWCPRGTVYMDSMAIVHPNTTVLIASHGGSSSEPMLLTAYANGMSDYISGYPHILVNRIYADDPTQAFNLYNAHNNDFGLADVDLAVNYNSTTRQSVVTATITSAVDIDGDYRLACVYTEDNVTGPGNGTNTVTGDFDQVNYYSTAWNIANGYTPPGPLSGAGHDWAASANPVPATIMEYDFVARTIQGGFTGQVGSLPATMTAGGVYTYAFPAYSIPSGYNPANMKAHIILMDADHGINMNGNSKPLISTGVSTIAKGSFELSLSPNPASDQVYVNLNMIERDNVNLLVTDMLGKVCMNMDLGTVISGEQRFPIDITSLSSGTYFLSIIGNNGSATTKFIK